MAALISFCFNLGNEFTFVLFGCPIIVIISSIIGFLVTKKWYIVPGITLILFTILSFTTFNESFFFWVIVYTLIAVLVCFIMLFVKKGAVK
ncbi:DUF2651 family protein [Bacillus sp. IB182487]|uniref:DUF2651 family protein n=2 Tax=Metabacillus arenae TaxID=2771434 RepID=A0A926NMX6_9BACI|nr:DUF2651 family protein [Metabacillus arenae]